MTAAAVVAGICWFILRLSMRRPPQREIRTIRIELIVRQEPPLPRRPPEPEPPPPSPIGWVDRELDRIVREHKTIKIGGGVQS